MVRLVGETQPGARSLSAPLSTAFERSGLSFSHSAITTGDKFPDALASGPYLATDLGILLVSPLSGPVPQVIQDTLSAHAASVREFTFIACIEPVIGTVKGLLP